jgi:hypothetical protein
MGGNDGGTVAPPPSAAPVASSVSSSPFGFITEESDSSTSAPVDPLAGVGEDSGNNHAPAAATAGGTDSAFSFLGGSNGADIPPAIDGSDFGNLLAPVTAAAFPLGGGIGMSCGVLPVNLNANGPATGVSLSMMAQAHRVCDSSSSVLLQIRIPLNQSHEQVMRRAVVCTVLTLQRTAALSSSVPIASCAALSVSMSAAAMPSLSAAASVGRRGLHCSSLFLREQFNKDNESSRPSSVRVPIDDAAVQMRLVDNDADNEIDEDEMTAEMIAEAAAPLSEPDDEHAYNVWEESIYASVGSLRQFVDVDNRALEDFVAFFARHANTNEHADYDAVDVPGPVHQQSLGDGIYYVQAVLDQTKPVKFGDQWDAQRSDRLAAQQLVLAAAEGNLLAAARLGIFANTAKLIATQLNHFKPRHAHGAHALLKGPTCQLLDILLAGTGFVTDDRTIQVHRCNSAPLAIALLDRFRNPAHEASRWRMVNRIFASHFRIVVQRQQSTPDAGQGFIGCVATVVERNWPRDYSTCGYWPSKGLPQLLAEGIAAAQHNMLQRLNDENPQHRLSTPVHLTPAQEARVEKVFLMLVAGTTFRFYRLHCTYKSLVSLSVLRSHSTV